MQLDELQTEHQRREQRLQEVHCCSMRDMEHARQRDLKVRVVQTRPGNQRRAIRFLIGSLELEKNKLKMK